MNYINGISSKTPNSVVWRKLRKLSGKSIPAPQLALKINNQTINDASGVANALEKHFADVSSPRNYSPEFQHIRNSQVTLNLSHENSESYNKLYTLR